MEGEAAAILYPNNVGRYGLRDAREGKEKPLVNAPFPGVFAFLNYDRQLIGSRSLK